LLELKMNRLPTCWHHFAAFDLPIALSASKLLVDNKTPKWAPIASNL
jgi:hypothetical protein